jgi:repressor LexA
MGRKPSLTKEQAFEILNTWFIKHGGAPTVDEFRRAAGLKSLQTAFGYLKLLKDEGFIEKWPGARGLRPLKTPGIGLETISVPIVGVAPAGPLMVAEENREGWVKIPKEFIRSLGSKHFMLRVKGDSMNRCRIGSDLIEDGDLVLVRQQATANPNDVIVALIDGEATIKRLTRPSGAGYYVLKPESSNAKNQPIPVFVEKDFRVQGIVTRVFKNGANFLA